MSKNHFVSHFLPFQINITIFIFVKFFTKWLPSAILDVRNSLWITFLAILDQYRFIFYFLQNGCRWPFWMSENHFRSHFFWPFQIDTQLYFLCEIFDKMAAVGHFGCPKFTLHHISVHFRSIQIFYFFYIFFTKWLPVAIWMSENHFRSHFWPFQIDMQL